MSRYLSAAIAVLAIAMSGTGCNRADAQPQPLDNAFTLEEHDKIIAEAPGCSAECRIVAHNRRQCVVSQFECRALCTTLPECRPDGLKPMKACAIVRTRP